MNKMCREVWRPDGVEGWEAIGVYTVESEVWMNGTVGDRGLYAYLPIHVSAVSVANERTFGNK